MKRDIYPRLAAWKLSPRRKPLILDGARQVGKTYALKHFGRTSYEKMAYFNFEKDEKLAGYFNETLEPRQLIKMLALHLNVVIEPKNTLIIFDEVQECPKALNSLKYYSQEANDYHLVGAGSLLGIKTAQEKGFPVGKVNFLQLYPLNFFEFLSATNQEELRDFLEKIEAFEPLPDPLHEKLIQQLRTYFFLGGMPEAVAEYIKNDSLQIAREVQLEILNAYARDFTKHAPLNEVMNITLVWEQIHRQLAKENKKFIFAAIRKSARGRDYEEAIQWLSDAGLIYKSFKVETPNFPLSAYADHQAFKIFLVDVGLLGAQSHLSPQVLLEGHELFTEFKGALTENFVAQEFIASQHNGLYYWTSSGTAEVDFLLESDNKISPLEVKAGNSHKKKSLRVFGEKYSSPILNRATLMNLKQDGIICNYPLYLISRLNKIQ